MSARNKFVFLLSFLHATKIKKHIKQRAFIGLPLLQQPFPFCKFEPTTCWEFVVWVVEGHGVAGKEAMIPF